MEEDRAKDVNTPATISDIGKRYPVMSLKGGFALIDNDRKLIREHSHQMREALFACTTQAQVECSVAFARYLSYAGLSSDNYWLFMRLVMTNNPWVIDELLHDREPRLLFSTIRPDADLIEAAFQALFSRHPEEIYAPALEAMLGVVQNAYFDPDDGYRIRKFSIMDINTLGKFLLKGETQDHPVNRLVLEILDKLAQVGVYYGEPDKNVLSKHAFNVRYAYFDRTRNLVDAIPEPLLVRLPDRGGVHPEDDYAELMASRRQRRRDSFGRFVKESVGREPVAPSQNPAPRPEVDPMSTQSASPAKSDIPAVAVLPKKTVPPAKPVVAPSSKPLRGESSEKPAVSKEIPKKTEGKKPVSNKLKEKNEPDAIPTRKPAIRPPPAKKPGKKK